MSTEELVARLRERLTEARKEAEPMYALFEEGTGLRDMIRIYEGMPGDARDENLLKRMGQRLRIVDERTEPLLVLQEEIENLNQLLATYRWQSEQTAAPLQARENRREAQRMRVRRYLDFRRHRERMLAERGRTERNQEAHRVAASDIASASYRVAERLATTVKQAVTQSERILAEGPTQWALLPGVSTQTSDADGAPHDRIGAAARDFMINNHRTEVRFVELYPHLLTVLPDVFADSPTDSARVEAFRYHLRKGEEKYGLQYRKGTVFLQNAVMSSEGGEAG